MNLFFLAALAFLYAGSISGAPVDFTDDFSGASLTGWKRLGANGAVLVPNGGRADGAGVLVANGKSGSGLSRSFPAVPGTYELVFWSKPVGVSGPIGVRGGVEFYDKNGNFVHPYFYGTPSGQPDAFGWFKTVVQVPRVPREAASIQIFCQLAPHSTGKVYFDDISFRPAISPLLAVMLHPANETARPGDRISLQIVHANGNRLSGPSNGTVRVTGPDGFPPLRLSLSDGHFSFVMPPWPDGPCPLTITLENAPPEAAPKDLSFPLTVRRRPKRTTFDSLGRMFVEGKPFMPLGFFSSSAFDIRTTNCLAQCGANVILPYCSFGGLGHTVGAIRKTIATLDGLGVKTIFSLKDVYPGTRWSRTSFDGAKGCEAVVEKVVKGLTDCPGLLAWYLNDEMSFSDMLVRRRDDVAALDPDHPALVEVYQTEVAPAYRRTADIFSICSYPVGTNTPAETVLPLEVTERSATAFGCEGHPVWGVPQCHNSAVYGKKGARTPTEEEMRTVALQFAGLGCKGFLFYNLSDLWSPNLPNAQASFAAHWPEVCRVFAFLKSFEPWIMSATPVEQLKIRPGTARGNVRVYRFRDDKGLSRLVFVGGGPGPCECRLRLSGKGKSLFGRTVRRGDEWVFSGEGLCSDVVVEDETVALQPRLVIWDDDGCDMTHYPYRHPDLATQPASVRNFERVFLEATERTKTDVIGYSGTMGFGFFTQLRTGGFVNTNRFAGANEPWRNAVNEFAALGLDSMDIATAFARRNGKEIFLSLRFNDNHDVSSTLEKPNCLFSPFKKQHPEWTVGRGGSVKCCGRWAADFAHPEVRDFVRTYIRSYLENYDLDGIEFDFFRHPQLFRTVALGGHATTEELALMTDLMRDFRRMADEAGRKRGRPFALCARVPDSREYCRAIGIDVEAWAAAKALDFLIVGGYFQLQPWRTSVDHVHALGLKCYASLDETRIPQVKGVKCLSGRNDKTCWIARMSAAMASGMDGVNLFNLEYFNHDDQRWILSHDIRDLDGVDKMYFAAYTGGGGYQPWNFLVGGRDYRKNPDLNPTEPVKLKAGGVHRFEIVIGDDFAVARQRGLRARVKVDVLAEGRPSPEVPFLVTINGNGLGIGHTAKETTSYSPDPSILRKGANAVTIEACAPLTLHDFRLTVHYEKAPF